MPNAGSPSTMTMASDPTIPVRPPGQVRPYPKHTSEGDIPFKIPSTGDKARTHYWLWGDLTKSSKVPLICLHGGPGVPHSYLLPISLIYEDYGIPVIMYDQVGCGASTHFKEKKHDATFFNPELFMAELDNLKSHLGIKTFDLLGQSWGGMMAGQYAITQPEGLNKVIVADSPASMITWVKVCDKLRAGLPKEVQETLTRCEKNGTTDTKEYEDAVNVFYQRHVCRLNPFPKELNDSFSALAEDNTVYETMNGPSEFYVTGSLKTWSIEEGLRQVTQRTVPGGILVINGRYDEAQDEAVQPYFTKPSAKVKWVRFGLSGHCPQLDETEEFILALGLFLTEE
ncbi:hypothetical protein B0A48_01154 [Cryoendolithus antarcticus]|uniref:AB hydrolase-1 domain-containing protein n=1 Tax=Cryoendolithus antarcticus TaxID=1507870 RepID=A0A1V8TSF2_9PEZI|nr:hypothetical protein B0A48_01154 [Cryoendolithus antarcticus]